MPLSKLPKRDMTPVRQKFCDDIKKQYVKKFNLPCVTTDADIVKLALSYKFMRADDKEIDLLLDEMHDKNTGADIARLHQQFPNPRGKP